MYAGAKLICDRIGVPQRNLNRNRKPGREISQEERVKLQQQQTILIKRENTKPCDEMTKIFEFLFHRTFPYFVDLIVLFLQSFVVGSFSHQSQLEVFPSRLNDNKSPEISPILLSNLISIMQSGFSRFFLWYLTLSVPFINFWVSSQVN